MELFPLGANLLPLALLGALVGLDVVSFPQAMISRPVVAATLAGALVGSAGAGLLVGAVLELVALETLPVGASRYPEWGSAAVVGGALASVFTPPAAALVLAATAAVATAWVGGWSMHTLRRINGRWAVRRLPALAAGESRAVIGLQIRGILADLLRAGLVTTVALLLVQPVLVLALRFWELDPRVGAAVAAGLGGAVALGSVWRLTHAVTWTRPLLLSGLAVGTLLALVLA